MEDALSYRILVLNRLWQAVNIVDVKRGFSLLFQDHAKVIHSSDGNFLVMKPEEWIEYSLEDPPADDDCIHTVRLRIRVPRVLLLNHYDRVPVQEVKFNRTTVFERDDFTCQYCGHQGHERDFNLDHVIPRDRGGRTSWENIVTSCIRCNSRKANRLPHEAGMRLVRKPERPKWKPFVSLTAGQVEDESWNHFVSLQKG